VELVDLVSDRRAVAAALLGHDVDDHRLPDLAGTRQHQLERAEVMAVDGPGVLEAEAVEHGRRLDELLEALLEAVGRRVGRGADRRQVLEAAGDLVLQALVAGVDGEVGQVAGQAAHGRRVGAAVVVDHDDQVRRLQVRDLVQGLVGHPARQRSVSDHGDDVAGLALAKPRLGDPERVAERGRGVAVFDQVVF